MCAKFSENVAESWGMSGAKGAAGGDDQIPLNDVGECFGDVGMILDSFEAVADVICEEVQFLSWVRYSHVP